MANFFSRFSLIKVNDSDIESSKNEIFENVPKLWDPIGNLPLDEIKNNAALIEAKFKVLENNPNLINKHYFLLTLSCVLIVFIALITGIIFMIFFAIMLIVFLIYYYTNLSRDLIKLEIAKENNWLYDPEKNKSRQNSLAKYFPEIFNKGNQNEYVEDQFWGLYNLNNKLLNFYSGLFHYEIETGSGKNRRVEKYDYNFFIFPLEKKLKSRFYLFPENILSKIGNFFTKKEINTESIKFNKTFAFSYNGSKDENNLEIVKTLSPAIQEKLLDLNEKKGSVEVLFTNDVVIFLSKGYLIPKMKTNLRKSLKIEDEDKNYLNNQLKILIDISSEISKYLD